MATAPYIGNNDFRGYLNYLASSTPYSATTQDYARQALNFTGNDGGIDEGSLLQYVQAAPGDQYDDAYYQGRARDFVKKAYGDYTGYNTRSAEGGSSTGPSYDQGDLQFLNDQESQLMRMLQSAQSGLGSGLTNLEDSYNKEASGANQQRSRALEDFAVKREDTTRAKQSALGKVDTNARTLSDSLRRILGMASGSGSSAYQLAAPNAVARQASQQRGGVMEDYGVNFRNLDTAENRAKVDFEDLLADLAAQRKQRESDLRAGVLEREQDINSSLANVAGERARLMGGDYGSVRIAQQPYTTAINDRQSQLDSLFERFRTPYSVKPVNVQTPNLRDYTVDRAAINANRQSGASQYSPYAQFLARNRNEEERLT